LAQAVGQSPSVTRSPTFEDWAAYGTKMREADMWEHGTQTALAVVFPLHAAA
jgi:hypothetical protein